MTHQHDRHHARHDAPQGHAHGRHDHGHGHTHGAVDPSILSSGRGIWAVKWSFIGLGITAVLQIIIVILSNSVALLADTIHNVGDATTAIPLWIAFALALRKPTRRFTYGLGKVEDLAGVIVVLTILFSAIVAGYQAIDRFIHPQTITHLWAVAFAAVIGFIGNEAVAVFRIRVGKEISSAALIADGYHARVDGFTSLGVLAGVIGVWLGFPLADPIVGILITITILKIVWDSSKQVFLRLLDGVDPEIVGEIEHAVSHVDGVVRVDDIKARWFGHELKAEVTIVVKQGVSLEYSHDIATKAEHELHHHISYLSSASIMVKPDQVDAMVSAQDSRHNHHAHDHGHAHDHDHDHDHDHEHGHDHDHRTGHDQKH